MVDARKVGERLARLEVYLQELEGLRTEGRRAYETDLRISLAVDHALQLAIQAVIDIGAHLIAERGLGMPADYRGIFERLESVELDPELAKRLRAAAGMRNVLVHEYLNVDPELVWNALANLDDFRRFALFVQERLREDA